MPVAGVPIVRRIAAWSGLVLVVVPVSDAKKGLTTEVQFEIESVMGTTEARTVTVPIYRLPSNERMAVR